MSNNHLIVGLGGTGGKVIRQLRKTIERSKDAQGKGPSEARFEFLYVDTSEDELNKKEEWKVLGKEIHLARSQYLINTASNVRPVLNDPDSFPGLRDWIEPRGVFDFVNATTAGAAQRRKLGRVVFAQNAARFVKAVEDRLSVIESRHRVGRGPRFTSSAVWRVARAAARSSMPWPRFATSAPTMISTASSCTPCCPRRIPAVSRTWQASRPTTPTAMRRCPN